MKKLTLMTILLALFCFNANANANAKENVPEKEKPEWVKNLEKTEDCDEKWKILWSQAKLGNQEVKYLIFFYSTPMPQPLLILPGREDGTILDYVYDIAVWSVYAYDYYSGNSKYLYDVLGESPEESTEHGYRMLKVLKGWMLDHSDKDYDLGREFFECTEKKQKNCTQIAIENRFVPSFESYAKKMDALMAAGMKASCYEGDRIDKTMKY